MSLRRDNRGLDSKGLSNRDPGDRDLRNNRRISYLGGRGLDPSYGGQRRAPPISIQFDDRNGVRRSHKRCWSHLKGLRLRGVTRNKVVLSIFGNYLNDRPGDHQLTTLLSPRGFIFDLLGLGEISYICLHCCTRSKPVYR